MSLDIRNQAIPASGSIRVGQGNFFFLITASVAVNLNISVGGQSDNFTGAIAGIKIQRVKRWDYLDIVGPAGTVLQFMVGFENVREDDVNIQQALATIAGTVAVAALPSASVSSAPAQTTLAAGATSPVAANLSRRRVTIGCLSTSAAAVRVSPAGTTLTGIELQPGVFAEFDTTAALVVRNDTATPGAIFYVFEES